MKEIVFSLPQEALEGATQAVLLGDFNNWDIDQAIVLTLHEDGILRAIVSLEIGKTYEYRYLLNDGRWVNDWAANGYVHKAHFGIDNSVITVIESEISTKPSKAKAPTKKAKVASPKTAAPAKAKKAPKKESTPAADDLTKIEGIGSAIAQLLQKENISSFKELSKATGKNLKSILTAAGNQFSMHDPKTWPKQAKLAASGKWEELKKLQLELTGGK